MNTPAPTIETIYLTSKAPYYLDESQIENWETLAMSTTLPRPDISISESDNGCGGKSVTITASRDNKSKSWSGTSVNTTGATKEAVEKMLSDRSTAEYLP